MARSRASGLVWVVAIVGACSGPPSDAPPGRALRDSARDGLFGSFMDGKFDSAGHPFGAQVLEAETACSPETGELEAEGWGARPGAHVAGTLCKASVAEQGPGPFTVNVRLLTETIKAYPPCPGPGPATTDGTVSPSPDGGGCALPPEVATLRVIATTTGQVLATKTIGHDQFRQALTYQNLYVNFTLFTKRAVQVELEWSGLEHVRVDYIEVFRAMQRVVIDRPSGVLVGTVPLGVEVHNASFAATIELFCDEKGLEIELATLLATGAAKRTETEFRTLLSTPSSPLLDGCPRPAHLLAKATFGYHMEAARVTYSDAPVQCSFEPGTTRVLITGFETFPALTSWDNSSEQAVKNFDASQLPGVSVMRVILPVEWDIAAAMVEDLIDRCQPDLVIGFGQGRSQVEPERVAYNLKDASDISGGVPDNRGIVYDGVAVAPGGPAEHATGLPAQEIVDALARAGIDAQTSDDPGRYICNNLFYSIMHKVQGTATVGGFIHMPRIPKVDAAEQARLQTIVETAIRETLFPTLVFYDFEQGLTDGWAVVNAASTVGWTVAAKRAASGTQALYYGDPAAGSYADGDAATKGTATLTGVALPAGKKVTLSFQLYMDTESGPGYDALRVLVNGAEAWVKDATPASAVSQRAWQKITVDLSGHAGQTVDIAFAFDSGDGIANSGEGVYIDDVSIASSAK